MSNEDVWNTPPPTSKASKKKKTTDVSAQSNARSSPDAAPNELSDDDDETWTPDDDPDENPKGAKASHTDPPLSHSNRNPQSDDQSLRSVGSLTSVLSRVEAIYNEFKSFTAKTNEQFTKGDSRLTAREATDATILQRMTTNQAETLTSMKSQFEGMMAQVMQQLASPTIDPSPSSRRSHSTLTESQPRISPPSTTIPHTSTFPNQQSTPSQGGGSMSTASGGSSESSSFQPQAKKFRSLRNDMNHMSFDSANSDSDLSALGDILYSNHNPLPPITSPSPPATTHHDTDTSVLPAALPDSNTQYKAPRDSNGGAPS